MTKWNPTCDRFVAFFDIMGFKDSVFRIEHEKILSTMEKMQESVHMIELMGKMALRHKKKKGDNSYDSRMMGHMFPKMKILPVFFSDSILLVSADDSEDSAEGILAVSSLLISQSLFNQIPIKGALAYGKQTSDFKKSLHFGKPLIDAYMLQSEMCMYGGVLHHTIEVYLREHKVRKRGMIEILEELEGVCKYKTPFKGCSVNHYCLNWLDQAEANEGDVHEIVSRLYDTVSGSTRHYVDNTMDFVKAVEASKPKK
jgi:hypothetical protein